MLTHMKKPGVLLKLLRFLSWYLLIGGSAVFVVGLGFAAETAIFLIRSTAVTGAIIRFEPIEDHEDGTINYAPVFSFKAEDEKTYTVQSGVATNPPAFEEGQRVQVLYLPSNPSGARIASFFQLWFVSFVCSGLGVFFGVPGYLLVRLDRRRRRRAVNPLSSPAIS
jgi:Protein of unknown function (DUF3592)